MVVNAAEDIRISNGRLSVSPASVMSNEVVGVGKWMTFLPEIFPHGILFKHQCATFTKASATRNFIPNS